MTTFLQKYKEAIISTIFLIAAVIVQHLTNFQGSTKLYLALYAVSYLAVGGPIWVKAVQSIKKGTIFGEFLLMGIATIGAFLIGKYAEGVAVMLLYTIGEYAQHGAVDKARGAINKLLKQQADEATVERDGETEIVHPSNVKVGEVIRVKPGEKVPLDGTILDSEASFNTAALTGESKPMKREPGEEIWAGSINQDTPVRIEVTERYQDTKLAHILSLVQKASQRKAPTQRFITRFAKIYTPAVVWIAIALTFLPWFFVNNYVFEDWLYRGLIFLVVSCPCGLVISIPLGYFAGIGAASQHGILFKGSDFLDRLRKIKSIYFDKTGTLTRGVFDVQTVQPANGLDRDHLLQYAAALEHQSTHPIARAVVEHSNGKTLPEVEDQQEVSGQGVTGKINDRAVAVGNNKLMHSLGVSVPDGQFDDETPNSRVHVAIDQKYAGYITISDQIKEDSRDTVNELRRLKVRNIGMLSGDHSEVVRHIANQLNLDEAHGELMPDEKYHFMEQALSSDHITGYVGDGINDAPVITLSDVGMAMGGIGSDATVETADVVIQTDHPSLIPTAIDIARFTHRIMWQNIVFVLAVKALVLILAAMGEATMWEAIFADVGVALIAVANAARIQFKS